MDKQIVEQQNTTQQCKEINYWHTPNDMDESQDDHAEWKKLTKG